MNRRHFLDAARTLASDHGLSIVDCLRKREWAIASEIAEDLEIHITTATKDLSCLYDCGILERRKGRRKTRPAYEYKLRSERIQLDLDPDEPGNGSYEEIAGSYVSFSQRLFIKAKKMGWNSMENDVARELGHGGEYPPEVVRNELWLANQAGGVPEVRSAFRRTLEKMRGAFVVNLGETATARIFEAAAREESQFNAKVWTKYRLLEELGVTDAN